MLPKGAWGNISNWWGDYKNLKNIQATEEPQDPQNGAKRSLILQNKYNLLIYFGQ